MVFNRGHRAFYFVFLFLMCPAGLFANAWSSQKQLNSLTAITPACGIALYLDAYGGTETSGVDTGDFEAGGASVSIQYSLNAGAGNYAECLMNYGSDVQDFSFDDYGISVWVQGTAGSTETLRLQLYEDNNLDGSTSDTGDQVWYSDNTTALSSGTWTQVVFPFSSFSILVSNGGNGVFHLNRIGEWSIRAVSTTGSPVSNTIHLNDIELLNNYVQPANNSILSGSFFQLWNTSGCNCGGWSAAQWNSTAAQMKALCQNTIYVQYSIWSDGVSQYVAWYPSSLGWVTSTYDAIDNIFTAANANGLKVVLGLYFSDSWNTANKTQASLYNGLLTNEEQVISELYTRYGANSAFGGWYIPQEADDLQWQVGSTELLLANYYQNVAAYCKTKTSLPVMIAPFFGPNQPADVYQSWWNTLFATTSSLDAVYVQDSVGTLNCDVDVDVPNYYQALKNACNAASPAKTFGSTVESFTQTHGCPVDNSAFASVPASIGILESQLAVEGSYTTNLVQFEWANMESSNGAANTTLYNNYVSYQQTAAPCGLSTNTATQTPTNTATSTPTQTVTNTSTNTVSSTATNSATESPTSSSTQTATNSPTQTATNSVTDTATATPTATGPTATFTLTLTMTSTYSVTQTPTLTPTATMTNSFTPSSTPTLTDTPTVTLTPTQTPTLTPTATLTDSYTPSSTPTLTDSPTVTLTPTASPSPTNSPLPTSTPTKTLTFTPSATNTNTSTPAPFTPTPTATVSGLVPYPNPCSGTSVSLNFPMSRPGNVEIEIFTLAFRKVQDHVYPQVVPGTTLTVPLLDNWGNTLANGLYYLIAVTPQGRYKAKLLVLR